MEQTKRQSNIIHENTEVNSNRYPRRIASDQLPCPPPAFIKRLSSPEWQEKLKKGNVSIADMFSIYSHGRPPHSRSFQKAHVGSGVEKFFDMFSYNIQGFNVKEFQEYKHGTFPSRFTLLSKLTEYFQLDYHFLHYLEQNFLLKYTPNENLQGVREVRRKTNQPLIALNRRVKLLFHGDDTYIRLKESEGLQSRLSRKYPDELLTVSIQLDSMGFDQRINISPERLKLLNLRNDGFEQKADRYPDWSALWIWQLLQNFSTNYDDKYFMDRDIARIYFELNQFISAGHMSNILQEITIAGTSFLPICASNSQIHKFKLTYLKKQCVENSVYEWAFRSIPEIFYQKPFYAAVRLSLLKTPTVNTIDVNIGELNDIESSQKERGKNVSFTDGCGIISRELAVDVWNNYIEKVKEHKDVIFQFEKEKKEYLSKEHLPSLFQIRYGGYKGTIMLSCSSEKKELQLRPSMKKFETPETPEHSVLEIVNFSSPSSNVALSPQITHALLYHSQEKNPKNFLGTYVNNTVAQYLLDEWIKYITLPSINTEEDLRKVLIDMDDITGINMLNAKIIGWEKIKNFRLFEKFVLKNQCSFPIPDSRLLFGCCDISNELGEGEVFIQITGIGVLESDVIISKDPCYRTSGILKRKAKNVEALKHLRDVIVFPVKGEIPDAFRMSGSDLDGDQFVVIWNENLVPFVNIQPTPPVEVDNKCQNDELNSPRSLSKCFVNALMAPYGLAPDICPLIELEEVHDDYIRASTSKLLSSTTGYEKELLALANIVEKIVDAPKQNTWIRASEIPQDILRNRPGASPFDECSYTWEIDWQDKSLVTLMGTLAMKSFFKEEKLFEFSIRDETEALLYILRQHVPGPSIYENQSIWEPLREQIEKMRNSIVNNDGWLQELLFYSLFGDILAYSSNLPIEFVKLGKSIPSSDKILFSRLYPPTKTMLETKATSRFKLIEPTYLYGLTPDSRSQCYDLDSAQLETTQSFKEMLIDVIGALSNPKHWDLEIGKLLPKYSTILKGNIKWALQSILKVIEYYYYPSEFKHYSKKKLHNEILYYCLSLGTSPNDELEKTDFVTQCVISILQVIKEYHPSYEQVEPILNNAPETVVMFILNNFELDLNCRTSHYSYPLLDAICNKNYTMINYLLKRNCDTSVWDIQGMNALHSYYLWDQTNEPLLQQLLAAGCPTHWKDLKGNPAHESGNDTNTIIQSNLYEPPFDWKQYAVFRRLELSKIISCLVEFITKVNQSSDIIGAAWNIQSQKVTIFVKSLNLNVKKLLSQIILPINIGPEPKGHRNFLKSEYERCLSYILLPKLQEKIISGDFLYNQLWLVDSLDENDVDFILNAFSVAIEESSLEEIPGFKKPDIKSLNKVDNIPFLNVDNLNISAHIIDPTRRVVGVAEDGSAIDSSIDFNFFHTTKGDISDTFLLNSEAESTHAVLQVSKYVNKLIGLRCGFDLKIGSKKYQLFDPIDIENMYSWERPSALNTIQENEIKSKLGTFLQNLEENYNQQEPDHFYHQEINNIFKTQKISDSIRKVIGDWLVMTWKSGSVCFSLLEFNIWVLQQEGKDITWLDSPKLKSKIVPGFGEIKSTHHQLLVVKISDFLKLYAISNALQKSMPKSGVHNTSPIPLNLDEILEDNALEVDIFTVSEKKGKDEDKNVHFPELSPIDTPEQRSIV